MYQKILLRFIPILMIACNQPATKNTEATGDRDTTKTTAFQPASIKEQMIYQRAIDAAIWGMPAVNYDLMLQEMLTKTSAKQNEIIY